MPAKNKRLTRTLTFISQKIKLKEFIDEKLACILAALTLLNAALISCAAGGTTDSGDKESPKNNRKQSAKSSSKTIEIK